MAAEQKAVESTVKEEAIQEMAKEEILVAYDGMEVEI